MELSTWDNVTLIKLTAISSVKIFSWFIEPKVRYSIHETPPFLSTLSQMTLTHIFTPYISRLVVSSFEVFRLKFVYIIICP